MRSLRRTARLAAPLLALLLGGATSAVAQTVEPGGSAERSLGPLSLTTAVEAEAPRVRVTLALRGRMVGEAVLTPEAPVHRFDLRSDGVSAAGTLSLARVPAPGLSSVRGDLAVHAGRRPRAAFRGSVATWRWPEHLPWTDQRLWLGPELSVRTVARDAAGSEASVTLYAGAMVLDELVMTQASPVAVVADDLVLGDARVAAGTSFTLTPATPRQRGQVLMRGRYQTRTTPETPVAAAVATWAWTPPPDGAEAPPGSSSP